MSKTNSCPSCGVSWIGNKIPDDIVEHYNSIHWKREICIDGGHMGIYDDTVALKCPDCGHECARNDSKWSKELFEKYQKALR